MYSYKISIKAATESEAERKMKAISSLASSLDAKTLEALARKVPEILRDPIKSAIVRSQLGI